MSSANVASAQGKALTFSLPPDLGKAVEEAQASWDREGKTDRLWNKDASLWTDKDESQWLDWMDVIGQQLSDVATFKALAAEIQEDAFNHILLLGMGGSSLCPEVFSMTWGKQSGFPELLVLDSTDPVQIACFRKKIDPARTLFCVSSKSGTTLEPNIYMQYFFDEAKKVVGDRVGHHFIAITDPGSKLESVANELKFRRVYYGNPRIGGRYSALSDFGLVPHAAAGLDTEKLLKRAAQMEKACRNEKSAENPGVLLGLVLGTAAKRFGRDKVTADLFKINLRPRCLAGAVARRVDRQGRAWIDSCRSGAADETAGRRVRQRSRLRLHPFLGRRRHAGAEGGRNR